MKHNIKNEYEEIIKLIDDNSVVSFDIYDTVLLRNVLKPTDIFDIVGLKLTRSGFGFDNFKKERIEAEKRAREISDKEDITLEEIYRIFAEKIGDKKAERLKEIELKTEEEFTTKNKFIFNIYKYCMESGKKVYFISDMYLPKDFLKELLHKNGFDAFEGLYVSGDIGKSKATGSLYDYIRSEGISDRKWVHIGDNYIADYKNAIKNGVEAFYYKDIKSRRKRFDKYSIQYSIVKSIQINMVETEMNIDYWEEFGINNISTIMYGFVLWIIKNSKNKSNLFFLSRDGYLPYKIYSLIQKRSGEKSKARYIYASRKAFIYANFGNMEKNEVIELITTYNINLGQKVTLGEVFNNLGLEKESYSSRIQEFGFSSFDDLISNDDANKKAKLLFENLYDDIIDISIIENKKIKKYFLQNNLYDFNEINIVDVGWRGSTQKALEKILEKDTYGFYFGTSHNVYDEIRNHTQGYAFNLGKSYRTYTEVMDNVMMYEQVFTAPQGSLLGFVENHGKIEPHIEEVDENDFLIESVKKTQKGVLKAVNEYLKYNQFLEDIPVSECIEDYRKFIKSKDYNDLVHFEKLSTSVGIGASEDVQRFVSKSSIHEYLKYKRRIKKKAKMNLWKDAVIVEGSSEEFENRLNMKRYFSGLSYISTGKIIKGIKNPYKAIKFIYRNITNDMR